MCELIAQELRISYTLSKLIARDKICAQTKEGSQAETRKGFMKNKKEDIHTNINTTSRQMNQ
jgi:hypothetical protein